MGIEEDLHLIWQAVETCECPEWAVGNRDSVAAALERIAHVATQKFQGKSRHRCKDANREWVACPPEMCEADSLLEELRWWPTPEQADLLEEQHHDSRKARGDE